VRVSLHLVFKSCLFNYLCLSSFCLAMEGQWTISLFACRGMNKQPCLDKRASKLIECGNYHSLSFHLLISLVLFILILSVTNLDWSPAYLLLRTSFYINTDEICIISIYMVNYILKLSFFGQVLLALLSIFIYYNVWSTSKTSTTEQINSSPLKLWEIKK
jgi:hypothetical protein